MLRKQRCLCCRHASLLDLKSFVLKQGNLAMHAARKTGQCALGPDHPVAGDQHRNRVGADGDTYSTMCVGAVHLFRQVTVTDRLAWWNAQQGLPDAALKGCAVQISRPTPHRLPPKPIGFKVCRAIVQNGVRANEGGGDPIGAVSLLCKPQTCQPRRRACCQHRAKRRRNVHLGNKVCGATSGVHVINVAVASPICRVEAISRQAFCKVSLSSL